MLLLFVLLLTTSITYSDISKLRSYPSEITVTFDDLRPVEIPANVSWRERKKYDNMKPELVSYQRFIRIVNALDLAKDEHVYLNFYDAEDNLIEQHTITNTTQPSPKYIFFMDRDSGRKFKGVLDAYHIPEEAHYFQIATDETIATHPDFEKRNKILISQYEMPNESRRLMLQLELLGTGSNITTRLGIFHFPKL